MFIKLFFILLFMFEMFHNKNTGVEEGESLWLLWWNQLYGDVSGQKIVSESNSG